LTPRLDDDLAHLGTWLPFEKAARMLGRFRRVDVSEPTVRRRTLAAGAALEQTEREAVERLEREALEPLEPLRPEEPPAASPERLVVEVDGAMVPVVGGGWVEAKTLVIGIPEAPRAGEVRLKEASFFSRRAPAETFERWSAGEIERRGAGRAGAVGAVSDAAEWIQGFFDYHCPNARRILDFPHVAERIAPFSPDPAEPGEGNGEGNGEAPEGRASWLSDRLRQLKHDGPRAVLDELAALQATDPSREDWMTNLAYLEKRTELMRYPEFRAEGWPIGSGAVESANKGVVEFRLKGAGMRWAEDHLNPMLALRSAACSDRWDEAIGRAQTALRRQAALRRREGRLRRRRAPFPRAAGSGPRRKRAAQRPHDPVRNGPNDSTTPSSEPAPARTTQRRPTEHPWRRHCPGYFSRSAAPKL
jgi:hypothetical protein